MKSSVIFKEKIINNILIPTNKNPVTLNTIDYIVSLFPHAKYYVLGVVEVVPESTFFYRSYSSAHRRQIEEFEKEAVAEIKNILVKKKVAVEEKILYGQAVKAILTYAKKVHINLIVLATTSKSGVLELGSTPKGVITRTKIPSLLVTPHAKLGSIKKILNPSTFSKYSFRASLLAIRFAKYFNAQVIILKIGKNVNENMIKHIVEYAKDQNVNLEFIELKTENVETGILEYAKTCDIIIASRGRRGIHYKFRFFYKEFAIGHVEKHVISAGNVPIILVNE